MIDGATERSREFALRRTSFFSVTVIKASCRRNFSQLQGGNGSLRVPVGAVSCATRESLSLSVTNDKICLYALRFHLFGEHVNRRRVGSKGQKHNGTEPLFMF